MNLQQRLAALSTLGERIIYNTKNNIWEERFSRATAENGWFTKENIERSLLAIAENYLQPTKLEEWLSNYEIKETNPKTIALVMAGNIPLVGFHDLISVLASGNKAMLKLSSKDEVLPKLLINELIDINGEFKDSIIIADRLADFDAVIATGSNNSARYFEYYFGKYPHIIRSSRNSVAVMSGEETNEELFNLGKDIFSYFGLGCRNVCKLYIPIGYDLVRLLDNLSSYKDIINFHKYQNNYMYHLSLFLLNKQPHLDTGFLILKEDERIASPTSVIFYEYYTDRQALQEKLGLEKDKIQCIVAKDGIVDNPIPFGNTQQPELWDYADGIDTMKFLLTEI
ncbi:MAG: acyl-CoA reductase [Bacteroidetes bacterium]|nr:acyl-CoA reductase [Bacteroidota bacterium]